ncbi:MAG TPA: hypothetical protein VHM19_12820 [Polyangiales bacterium]|nr:hypothetical protein [Polyangiales bacterium]
MAQVCRVLTTGIAKQPLFGAAGPSELAQELRSAPGTSGGDRALLELAFWLWEGGVSPRVSGLVELLDRTRLRLVGSLLIALADGSGAIERWLKANGGPVGDA